MTEAENKKRVAAGLFWKIMENGGSQGVQFIVSIILARLLSPTEYGTVAIMTIFITLANVLVQNGFATALIQKKAADGRDFSSVFFLNLITAALAYLVLYISAPAVAGFYRNPEIIPVFRLLALIVFPGAAISVQNAYVSRKLEFRKLFNATLAGALLSGAVSIFLAYGGFKVYALVWQQIIYYFTVMAVLFISISWRPELIIDTGRLKGLFGFGWKILAASTIDTFFNNLQGLVMGKAYSEAVLGNYSRGEQFPKLIVSNLGSAIQSVMLPLMSQKQESYDEVKGMLRRSVMLSSYLILPMMSGLIAVADTLVLILLGEKWSGAVIFLQLSCVAYSFWPIHIANLQALNATGRSDVFLKLEIIKKSIGLAVLIAGIPHGAAALIAMKAAADFLSTFINAWPNKKILGYSIFEQWRDILPSLIISMLMGAAVWFCGRFCNIPALRLVLQIVCGVSVYLILSFISANESFIFLKNQFFNERRK